MAHTTTQGVIDWKRRNALQGYYKHRVLLQTYWERAYCINERELSTAFKNSKNGTNDSQLLS